MKIRTYLGLVLSLVLSLLVIGHVLAGEADEQEAVDAARNWLKLVDANDYGESWDEAAALFRNALTREQWEQGVANARAPLGEVVSRKLKSSRYMTSLPGAPDGEYVVIQFTTAFQNRQSAVETVTPMRDEDGEWRVSGYFIK